MSLSKAIHFIKGSISTSDLVPAFRFVQFDGQYVLASNGVTTAAHPYKSDFKTAVEGAGLVRAVNATKGEAAFSMTKKGGRVRMASDNFCVFLESNTDINLYPRKDNDETELDLGASFIEVLTKLLPFIAVDGQQYWAGGVLFQGNDLFATDSKTLIQTKIPFTVEKPFVLPFQGIKELLRIKHVPDTLFIGSTRATFGYTESESHLSVATLDAGWPPVKQLLDKSNYKSCVAIPDDFFEALEKLKPFTDEQDTVYLKKGTWRTSPHSNTGAVTKCLIDCNCDGCYDINQLINLQGVATKIDLSQWPNNVPFTGKKLRGVVTGRVR